MTEADPRDEVRPLEWIEDLYHAIAFRRTPVPEGVTVEEAIAEAKAKAAASRHRHIVVTTNGSWAVHPDGRVAVFVGAGAKIRGSGPSFHLEG